MDMVSRFAPVDVDGVPVLMSALEIETWGQEIRDARPIDRALKTLLVYGGYIPCRVDHRKAVADMRAAPGKTIGLVWADLCRWASLEDIEIFESEGDGPEIPFAALIRTAEWMPGVLGSALAYFVRYPQMSMRMNILTRRGIFAVKTCESGYYSGSMYGWRWFIAECRAHQARDMAQVAYSYAPKPGGAKRDRQLGARIVS